MGKGWRGRSVGVEVVEEEGEKVREEKEEKDGMVGCGRRGN